MPYDYVAEKISVEEKYGHGHDQPELSPFIHSFSEKGKNVLCSGIS